MDIHLVGLEVIELLPDGGLVFRGQPGPGLVGPTVVVGAGRHLDVVVKLDDLQRVKIRGKVAGSKPGASLMKQINPIFIGGLGSDHRCLICLCYCHVTYNQLFN